MDTQVQAPESKPTGQQHSESAILRLDGVCKSYTGTTAVNHLDIDVREGELLTLLGPSGCGKTTTLRLIAGLERPDRGTVSLGSATLADADTFVPAEDRDIGIVFQDFALFPHLSVAENVGFGLADRCEAERTTRVEELLELVGLSHCGDQLPDELSGGQQQRIALARSLAAEPELLLLDEPFSNLDVDLRVRMREEVRRILKEAGVTAISVTHDQEEALSISDRVAVMNAGHLEQIGPPEAVFQQPSSRFVAGFLGHASFLSGVVSGDIIETGLGRIGRDQIHGLDPMYDHMEIDVLVRPDDVIARPVETAGDGNGIVTYRRYLGPTVLYRVELDNGDVVECMHNHSDEIALDERVRVDLPANHDLTWFPTADELTEDAD